MTLAIAPIGGPVCRNAPKMAIVAHPTNFA
jgi:hypothetical protein